MTTSQPDEAGRSTARRAIAAICAVAGLVASSALMAPLIDGRSFCRPGGGCDRVAHSAYATLFGVHRSVLGVIAFALLLGLAVLPGRRLRPVAGVVGAGFVLEGFHLLYLQALVIKAFCPFCVVVDIGSIVAGSALAMDALVARDADRPSLWPRRLAVAGAAALIGPLSISVTQPRALQTETIAPIPRAEGKLVLREFVDLECPYCRMTHVALKKALVSRPDVVVERRHVPLAMHEHAMGAAIAACCAGEQNAEEKFIDALVSVDAAPDDATCRRVILELRLDAAKYDECRKSERPKKRIDVDLALAQQTKVEGLPTIDLDGERHVGALDDERATAFLARHASP